MTTYPITKDDYFDRQQPAKTEELRNVIRITTQPLRDNGSAEVVYQTQEDEPILVPAGGTTTIEIIYSSMPVLDPVFSLDAETVGVTISGTPVEYAWGASVTLANSAGTEGSALIIAEAIVLRVEGGETIERRDDDSVLVHGALIYEVPENHLVQSRALGTAIAEGLLATYKDPRKDTAIVWRGDPALELGDLIEVPIYQRGAIDNRGTFLIFKNKISYDGGLKMATDGRKVA
jgi:hypothetical protein